MEYSGLSFSVSLEVSTQEHNSNTGSRISLQRDFAMRQVPLEGVAVKANFLVLSGSLPAKHFCG